VNGADHQSKDTKKSTSSRGRTAKKKDGGTFGKKKVIQKLGGPRCKEAASRGGCPTEKRGKKRKSFTTRSF